MHTIHRQHGFSMIEVLISLLVLSLGLLGLALLQGQGLKFNTDAYLRTQATTLGYEIIDRMRANPAAAASAAAGYHAPTKSMADAKLSTYKTCSVSGGTCDCDKADGSVQCSTANLALYDLGKWYDGQAKLPLDSNFPATITTNVIAACTNGKETVEKTVVVRWREKENLKEQKWTVRLYVPC